MTAVALLALSMSLAALAPYAASAQAACDIADATLIVRVKATGSTDVAALEALAYKTAAVRDAAGALCVTESMRSIIQSSDGLFVAATNVIMHGGSDAELREVVASVGDVGTPTVPAVGSLWYTIGGMLGGVAVAIVICVYIYNRREDLRQYTSIIALICIALTVGGAFCGTAMHQRMILGM